MAKKFKVKVTGQAGPDPAMNMMTEQEEKMYYAGKKVTEEGLNVGNIKKKNTSHNRDPADPEEQYDNISHLELSNLNQTSAQQITQFINKLIAKNKVTSRNAFDIPLIHLQQMQDFRSSLNQNTWKRLSSTLENDYKIYGYRVDAAHTITYKMVESIARHEAAGEQMTSLSRDHNLAKVERKTPSTNNQLLTSFIDTSFNNQNVSKNKMNVDYTKFIQKNQKLLNVTHIEAFFSCNPGLEKTKRKFDQQGLKALLLNNIAIRNGCQLKLDQHRKYDLTDNDETKKQNIEKSQVSFQNEVNFSAQFESMLEKVFNTSNIDKESSKIQLQTSQSEENVFQMIYDLNVGECKASEDEYKRFQRLYKIISGEEREEKRRQVEKKKLNQMVEENDQIAIQQQPVHPEVNEIVEQQPKLDNNIVEGGNEENRQQQQDIVKESPQLQNSNQQNDLPMTVNNTEHNQSNIQVKENPSISQLHPTEMDNDNQIEDNQQPPVGQSNMMAQIPSHNQPQNQQQNPPLAQVQPQTHALLDRNFQIHEMALDRMDQSSSKQSSKDLSPYTGKYKNIQEYIKIKQPKTKTQRKVKLLIDQLTSEQIGKKLFNRKYKKKKLQSTKCQNSPKQQSSAQYQKKKVDFSKLSKPSNDLKRSVVFKKSLVEEKTFTQIRQMINKRLAQRQKMKATQEQQHIQKRKKGKKTTKIFDLPVYQFQQDDTNYLQPYEQLNPETNQLQFSQIFKHHFPTFVQSSQQIINQLKKKRELKQLEEQAKRKQMEEKQRINAEKNDFMQQQNQQIQPVNEDVNPAENAQPNSQQFENAEPDISFIYDEMGQRRGRNQVAIRDAKEKVKKIILHMFHNYKSRKNKCKNHKKISFKEIYEAYYRSQGFISPALCFLTILHLANQHNLVLEGKQDGTDFKIFLKDQNQIEQQFQQSQAITNPSMLERQDKTLQDQTVPRTEMDFKKQPCVNLIELQ